MAADYRSMYLKLFVAVEDALTLLETGAGSDRLYLHLIEALQRAEGIYMETDDTVED